MTHIYSRNSHYPHYDWTIMAVTATATATKYHLFIYPHLENIIHFQLTSCRRQEHVVFFIKQKKNFVISFPFPLHIMPSLKCEWEHVWVNGYVGSGYPTWLPGIYFEFVLVVITSALVAHLVLYKVCRCALIWRL